jgi:diaminopimelate decarboxylase
MLALSDRELIDELERIDLPATRGRLLLTDVLERNLTVLQTLARRHAPFRVAYSVKTNPDPRVLVRVNAAEMHGEVISPQEARHATLCGLGGRLVYNGPVPAWNANDPLRVVFSDSIEAYRANVERLPQSAIGVRVRPRGIPSRFGIAADRIDELAQAIRAGGRRAFGVSMHVRPQDYGERTWRAIVEELIEIAAHVEARSGAAAIVFDTGGGKTPEEFDEAVAGGDFLWALDLAQRRLPHLREFFIEPGQALVTPAGLFVAPVVETRRGATREIVIDAGYPDVPQIGTFAHRLVAITDRELIVLPRGDDRVLGCTCLEYDIIRSGVRLPERLDRVHAIAIADCGAYDSSMSFDFARGGNTPNDDRGQARERELSASHPLAARRSGSGTG